ncbi:hypothetical protein [Flavilitoribacter nigricans]|uniref:Uncharacterized protein n=1 Tax=Flavilitoribacter nigricans (strain ATCC 23147 / DSM 23189 / NBRC 102662 / NCIMB 1420 / SS-2) TaxID=1122177 RepID=A0A2D0MWT4_FLAN2|nr:hypothetical protein [Flavilitoribacter nigricans]PHN00608.1 hypothetical protein CRP01_41380 [Flavilitoribacter nigricans DSM 23189 = NBRC 102662]
MGKPNNFVFDYNGLQFKFSVKNDTKNLKIKFAELEYQDLFDFLRALLDYDFPNDFKSQIVDFLQDLLLEIKEPIVEDDGYGHFKLGDVVVHTIIEDGVKYYKLNDVARACGMMKLSSYTYIPVRENGILRKGLTNKALYVPRSGLKNLFELLRDPEAKEVLSDMFFQPSCTIPSCAYRMYKNFLPQQTSLRHMLYDDWVAWVKLLN